MDTDEVSPGCVGGVLYRGNQSSVDAGRDRGADTGQLDAVHGFAAPNRRRRLADQAHDPRGVLPLERESARRKARLLDGVVIQ